MSSQKELSAAEYQKQFGSSVKSVRRKYRNEPCVSEGIRFDSKKEALRYCHLKLLESQGIIKDLQRQEQFPIKINGIIVMRYWADFTYTVTATGQKVVEDCKSPITRREPRYRIKKRCFAAFYSPLTITEV